MNIRYYLLLSALGCALPVLIAVEAREYDFFIAANINRNYVIGSKIVTTNGIFRRDVADAWQQVGYNDTGISAFAFDPRDRDVIYTTTTNGLWRSLDGGKLWRICNDSGSCRYYKGTGWNQPIAGGKKLNESWSASLTVS